ncbi:MAG: hypothetical protein QW569_03950 [Candidatus Bathyarchaeia archaeon]
MDLGDHQPSPCRDKPILGMEWRHWWSDIPLVVLRSLYRSVVESLVHYLDEVGRGHGDGQQAAVLLPEWVPAH